MNTNTLHRSNNNNLNTGRENKTMKIFVKMIIALALALTMICALGSAAFADNGTIVTKNPTSETHYVGENGNNYYTDGTVITPDCAPGYYWVNGELVYGG